MNERHMKIMIPYEEPTQRNNDTERLKLPSHELIALRDQNAMLENALLNERDASRASGIEMEEQLKAVTEQLDEALSDLEFRRDLFTLQEQQLNDVRFERVKLARELTTAREELAKFKSIAETTISDHEMSEIRNYKLTEQRDRLVDAIITHRAKAFPLTGEEFDQELWQALAAVKRESNE